MLVFIGDLHLKDKEPFLSSSKKLFSELNKNFEDDELLFLGDEFDTSAPSWELFSIFSDFLKNRKRKVYILGGNHTYSKLKGSVLEGIQHIKNVEIILNPKEIIYGKNKILCLPFKYSNMKEEYEKFDGTYDYIVTHTTPSHLAFGDEGINYQLKGYYIHGHTHITDKVNYVDKLGNIHLTLGVPYPTRYGEQRDTHFLFILEENGNHTVYALPYFHSYETIKFGDEPKNKNNIINITDAPDTNSVYERYKDYYIRDEGIELKRTEIDDKQVIFNSLLIKDGFKTFCIEQGYPKEVLECGLKYLEGI